MKVSRLLLLLTVISTAGTLADIVPTDKATPLFTLYEMRLLPHKGSDPHEHQIKLGKVLLSVRTLRDLRLLADGSGVEAVLNEKDTKMFARLTHTLDYMVLVCGDQKSASTMHISGPIDDGIIIFNDANYATHVGGYLLRRCRKAPNQSPQPTAGHSDASIVPVKPCLLQPALALTNDG